MFTQTENLTLNRSFLNYTGFWTSKAQIPIIKFLNDITMSSAPGHLVGVDVGCTVDGYWADTSLAAVVGEPSRDHQARYDALLEGEVAQLALSRPGISAGDLFNVVVEGVRKGALPKY
jgi:Xaa-Pro aminopeptidase